MRSAIGAAELDWPGRDRRITVSLAPAALKKEGSGFDLPIALAVLAASHQIPVRELDGHASFGELALDGRVRPVRGASGRRSRSRGSIPWRGCLLPSSRWSSGPPFQRPALEALRQPLEDGVVAIARAGGQAVIPARFQLVATVNLSVFRRHPTGSTTRDTAVVMGGGRD